MDSSEEGSSAEDSGEMEEEEEAHAEVCKEETKAPEAGTEEKVEMQ